MNFEPTTIRNHPERFLATTAWALARGYPLGRPMTAAERCAVALIAAHPTNTLTIHSKAASRSDMAALFRLLIKRLNRDRAKRRPRDPVPLIYVANLARAKGAAGYHAHALLWDYVHAATLIGHCKDLGLGLPQVARLPADAAGNIDYWEQVVYVPAQHEPLFGTNKHESNVDRLKSARPLLYPQKRTLERHCPELLSALEDANDPAVPDETLLARLPRFSNRDRDVEMEKAPTL